MLFIICLPTKTIPFNYDSWAIYLELSIASFLNFGGQALLLIVNQNANPTTVQLFGYTSVVYMFISDLLFFSLFITATQIVGVMICLICSVVVVAYKMNNLSTTNEATS